eukprot:UN01714
MFRLKHFLMLYLCRFWMASHLAKSIADSAWIIIYLPKSLCCHFAILLFICRVQILSIITHCIICLKIQISNLNLR